MSYENTEGVSFGKIMGISTTAPLILVGLIVLCMWGCPKYNVYSARKDGEAKLAHAQSSKEVQVCESKGKMEAARYECEADIIRATGAAQANKIIDSSLTTMYLHYLWLQSLQNNDADVIYVPTEANLPILEASREVAKKEPLKTN